MADTINPYNIVRLYTDSVEIVDILNEFDPIAVPPFNGKTIIQFINSVPKDQDFGIVLPLEETFYVLYKYGRGDESTLLMITTGFEYAKMLLDFMHSVEPHVFPNETIYQGMCNDLVAFMKHFKLA